MGMVIESIFQCSFVNLFLITTCNGFKHRVKLNSFQVFLNSYPDLLFKYSSKVSFTGFKPIRKLSYCDITTG